MDTFQLGDRRDPVAVLGGGDRAMAQGPAQSTPPWGPALERHKKNFYTSLPTAVSKRSGKPPKSGQVFKNIWGSEQKCNSY